MTLERRIRDAEAAVCVAAGAQVEEVRLDLPRLGVRARALSHGSGVPIVLLHGVTLSAIAWVPLFAVLGGCRLLAVDLPGHGLSDPAEYRRGHVRDHTDRLLEDIFDALELERAHVVGHSLGGMFALWHAARAGARIESLVAIGDPGRGAARPARAHAALASDHARGRTGGPAFSQSSSRASPPAGPGTRSRGGRRRAGRAVGGAAALQPPRGEHAHGRVIDARDRRLPPATSESVLTSAELAAITRTRTSPPIAPARRSSGCRPPCCTNCRPDTARGSYIPGARRS
jgi:pimeloyl-ACP methyl ester carboxylesterase